MKSVLLDTNIFLRFLLKDIPAQSEQIQLFLTKTSAEKINLIVPQIIIFEIEFALNKYYNFPKNEIIETIDSILGADYFNIQDRNIFQQALQIYAKHSLSFVDCFLLAQAEETNASIFSFDKELLKLIGDQVHLRGVLLSR